jgi:hypothetical protein
VRAERHMRGWRLRCRWPTSPRREYTVTDSRRMAPQPKTVPLPMWWRDVFQDRPSIFALASRTASTARSAGPAEGGRITCYDEAGVELTWGFL